MLQKMMSGLNRQELLAVHELIVDILKGKGRELLPAIAPAIKPAITPAIKPAIAPAIKPAIAPAIKPAIAPAIAPHLQTAKVSPQIRTSKMTPRPGVKAANKTRMKNRKKRQ